MQWVCQAEDRAKLHTQDNNRTTVLKDTLIDYIDLRDHVYFATDKERRIIFNMINRKLKKVTLWKKLSKTN